MVSEFFSSFSSFIGLQIQSHTELYATAESIAKKLTNLIAYHPPPEIYESDINGLALNLGIVAFCLLDVGTTEVGAEATSLPMIATCDG